MWNEWPFVTGNVHPIDVRYKHFWLAIVIVRPLSLFLPSSTITHACGSQVIWSLYAIGLLLLPRQFRQEAAAKHDAKEEHEG
jgi:hypothetical protein